MRAVMPAISEDILAVRRRSGADQYDEMWDGELHMPPVPSRFHQDIEFSLESYLRIHWARPLGAKVYHQINVASIDGWPKNYRIPDLVLLMPERFAIDRDVYFEGAPNVVVEIHSPGDESYEKFPFYAEIGVPEVWVIHRDTCVPEIHFRKRKRYKQQPPERTGWLRSRETGIELRKGPSGKFSIRMDGDDDTRQNLPED